jgi:hypothetical protein
VAEVLRSGRWHRSSHTPERCLQSHRLPIAGWRAQMRT